MPRTATAVDPAIKAVFNNAVRKQIGEFNAHIRGTDRSSPEGLKAWHTEIMRMFDHIDVLEKRYKCSCDQKALYKSLVPAGVRDKLPKR